MSKLKKISKVVDVVLVVCLIIDIYVVGISIAFNRDMNVPIVISSSYDYNNAFYLLFDSLDEKAKVKTKAEYKEIIENDMNFKFYIYTEKSMKGFNGKAYAVIRTIVMDSSLDGYQYCVTFAHEVIHIKQCVANESYVCFETFKYLYESEELHNIGVWYGIKQLTGSYGGEYNVADLIVDYLTNK